MNRQRRLLIVRGTSGSVSQQDADGLLEALKAALVDHEVTLVEICNADLSRVTEAVRRFDPRGIVLNSRSNIPLARQIKELFPWIPVYVMTGEVPDEEVIILPRELADTKVLLRIAEGMH